MGRKERGLTNEAIKACRRSASLRRALSGGREALYFTQVERLFCREEIAKTSPRSAHASGMRFGLNRFTPPDGGEFSCTDLCFINPWRIAD